MDIKRSLVTKIQLTDLAGLDPVQVIAEDLQDGWGRITISCYGKAWTNTWGGMGPQNLIEFVATCNVHYLAEKLMSPHNKYETDWSRINDEIDVGFMCSIDETTAIQYDDELDAKYGAGGDWRQNLPQRLTTDYQYLCRVIEAVIAAFKEITDG